MIKMEKRKNTKRKKMRKMHFNKSKLICNKMKNKKNRRIIIRMMC